MTEPSLMKETDIPEPMQLAEPAREIESSDDLGLVTRARNGEMSAYDELVHRYQERIFATIYHMTGNHEDANDLAQEAFIKAFQALNSFKGDSSFYTWVTASPSTRRSTFSSSARTAPI